MSTIQIVIYSQLFSIENLGLHIEQVNYSNNPIISYDCGI